MRKIEEELRVRQKELQKIKDEKEKALECAPPGHLRINASQGNTHYYHRTEPKDLSGKYIRKRDMEFIRALAQKEYDQKVLRSVDNELKGIEAYLRKASQISPEEIFEELHQEKKKLVVPIRISTEEYIRRWQNVKYESKGFEEDAVEIYTAKGERVRSKSEVIIADMLEREGIPYRYEYPLRLKGWGVVYPDFTLLHKKTRKEIYWEHLGMMDNPEYAENAIQKIALYEQNGIYPGEGLLLTYETRKTPINRKLVFRMIERYLK